MADHETRKRNEIRRFGASTAEKVALGAVGFGVLRPVFDPTVEGAWLTSIGSVTFGLLAYGLAIYLLNRLEDER